MFVHGSAAYPVRQGPAGRHECVWDTVFGACDVTSVLFIPFPLLTYYGNLN